MKISELYSKNKELIRYVIVGVLTTVVSLGVYYLCVSLFLDPNKPLELQAANIISWVAAVTFAYFANRKYVFNSTNKVLSEVISFFGARLFSLGLDMLCMFIMVTLLHLNDKTAKLLVQVIILIVNYILSKFFVFRNK